MTTNIVKGHKYNVHARRRRLDADSGQKDERQQLSSTEPICCNVAAKRKQKVMKSWECEAEIASS